MKLHHLAIQVTDLVAAEAFYADVLGLAVTRRQDHAVWVDAGGVIVMLERCSGGPSDDDWSSAQPGPFVVALSIRPDERATWRERLLRHGVTVHHESAFTIYFRDPFGTRLALSHYPSESPAT